jgi:hypothetical protein
MNKGKAMGFNKRAKIFVIGDNYRNLDREFAEFKKIEQIA